MDYSPPVPDGRCPRNSCGGLCLGRSCSGPLLATAGMGRVVGFASGEQSDASWFFSECPFTSSVGVVTRGSSSALVSALDSLEAWSDPWSCWIGAGSAFISSANVAFGLDACLPRHHFCAASAQTTGHCCGIAFCWLGSRPVVTADGKASGLCRLWFFQHLSDQASGAAQ